MIARPVTPGKEAECLITQAVAEYLAHVHEPPFDGLLFNSVQRKSGTNVVLFSKSFAYKSSIVGQISDFPIEFEKCSLELLQTTEIQYGHRKIPL
jgi:hypothetical protein